MTKIHSKLSKGSELSEDITSRVMIRALNSIIAEDNASVQRQFVVNDENRETMKNLKLYLSRKKGLLDINKGILFYGSVGTGKTLIMEMMKIAIFELWGKELTIFTAPYIKSQYYEEKIDNYSMSYMVQRYKFLGINDIGLEFMARSGDEIIRNILYERFEKRLFTFGTMNLEPLEFYKRYEYPDDIGRMSDRFPLMFNYVKLIGKSFR